MIAMIAMMLSVLCRSAALKENESRCVGTTHTRCYRIASIFVYTVSMSLATPSPIREGVT